MSEKINGLILAAGKGTRMNSTRPKALAPCLDRPMLDYVLLALEHFSRENGIEVEIGLVLGHGKDQIEDYLNGVNRSNIARAYQKKQLGTGHAVQCFFNEHQKALKNSWTFILCADTPCLTQLQLSTLYSQLAQDSNGVIASFKCDDPHGYGRIVREQNHFTIVEQKECSERQKAIKEVNAGVYLIKTQFLGNFLDSLDNDNKAQEFYLTDLFGPKSNTEAYCFNQTTPFMGVNDNRDLAMACENKQREINQKWMDEGVHMMDPKTTWIGPEVELAPGVVLYPNIIIEGKTTIAEAVKIESNCTIKNATIKKNCLIYANSYLEDCHIKEAALIGPFARLRPGAEIGEKSKVGNFVEIKKSKLHRGVKVSHLTYVGDAEVGANTNVGCGVTFVNYDGANKHKTLVGENSFIGSGCELIAPITLGKESFVAAGSTLNKDVPDGNLAIARGRQENKSERARKYFSKKSKKR